MWSIGDCELWYIDQIQGIVCDIFTFCSNGPWLCVSTDMNCVLRFDLLL